MRKKANLPSLIEITSKDGHREVFARIVSQHFAVHECIDELESTYTLTHLPTGRSLTTAGSIGRLTKLARALEKEEVEWDSTDHEMMGLKAERPFRRLCRTMGLL